MLPEPACRSCRGAGRNDRIAPRSSTNAGGTVCMRRGAKRVVLRSSNSMPNLASQMRVAFSSMAWNTGSSSPGDAEMTLSTSRGRGLLLQRLGEIVGALAQFVEQPRVLDGDDACAAKFCTSSICLSVNGPNLLAVDHDGADQFVVLEHRHDHSVRTPARLSSARSGSRSMIGACRHRHGRARLLVVRTSEIRQGDAAVGRPARVANST